MGLGPRACSPSRPDYVQHIGQLQVGIAGEATLTRLSSLCVPPRHRLQRWKICLLEELVRDLRLHVRDVDGQSQETQT